MDNTEIWKNKLAALLHDPPHKCLDIINHEDISKSFLHGAGISKSITATDERVDLENKASDHWASAADRVITPNSRKTGVYDSFSGEKGETFIHPFSGQPLEFKQMGELALFDEALKNAIGGIPETIDPKHKFFLYWRRWKEQVLEIKDNNARIRPAAYFPADTRIPDHTIWNHISLTSAFEACRDKNGSIKPALLLLQLGPVQGFIAQARSTRDLWSGSYLLSWLIAHGIKAIADEIGPDNFIFPHIKGNGILDALYREEIYEKIEFKGKNGQTDTLWDRIKEQDLVKFYEKALTPTLTNRFLALVPQEKAEDLAKKAEQAIHVEFDSIKDSCWSWVEEQGKEEKFAKEMDLWEERFDFQTENFLEVFWQVQDINKDALAEFDGLPNQDVNDSIKKRFEQMEEFLRSMPSKDNRMLSEQGEIKNLAVHWPKFHALCEYKLAARKNTRTFNAWQSDSKQAGTVKDSLSGKEEIVCSVDFWEKVLDKTKPFKDVGHRYGAINMIKRIWCHSGEGNSEYNYVINRLIKKSEEKKNFKDEKILQKILGFDSTDEISKKNNDKNNGYIAVLAIDGDEMGRWLSGSNMLELVKLTGKNFKKFLSDNNGAKLKRLVSPAFHAQFSEALSNFSTIIAPKVVESYSGQLVYSGGDDVLAMLPADKAMACAEALRDAWQGKANSDKLKKAEMHVYCKGFVRVGEKQDILVPGPEADLSCGIAVGHYKAPLQMLVKEAQKAEKLAKTEYGRSAVSVSLLKRSGEIILWGSKWDSGALALIEKVNGLIDRKSEAKKALSNRFAYALSELLNPYKLDSVKGSEDSFYDLICAELEHVLKQQGEGLKEEEKQDFLNSCTDYLEFLKDKGLSFGDFPKLFLVETFINRSREGNN